MISVVITAAGSSSRFGQNKLLLDLKGKPVIVRAVEPFFRASKVGEVILATRKEDMALYRSLFQSTPIGVSIVEGGKERIQSLYNGVRAAKGELILTHDGARPFVSQSSIEQLIQAVEEHGAAMTAVHPTATIKQGKETVQSSLPRDSTWIAQTPQGFKREILLKALESAIAERYFVPTDDSEIVCRFGIQVKIVEGDHSNLKMTVKNDWLIAKAMLENSFDEKNRF